ncbi:hypothetical protein EAS56_04070 [Bradyrhizobium guangzhouense]|uniref:Uncharacterized protein n=2 Tax=Bradyrhizobium TaxID=374 RepID=A0ABY0ECB2_9BRAD|nr:hypothetical protein XH86_39195 [Bradyrhizobium guangdongense]RXH17086.1 hypothetical protein EAS56_04070 [Bradyrhizobium guangzhouense]
MKTWTNATSIERVNVPLASAGVLGQTLPVGPDQLRACQCNDGRGSTDDDITGEMLSVGHDFLTGKVTQDLRCAPVQEKACLGHLHSSTVAVEQRCL